MTLSSVVTVFFGGLCVRPKAHGFSGCTVDCPRWKK